MSILLDASSRILIQGITGATGRAYAQRMVENGTPLVGGISPGKGGHVVSGVPVFDTAAQAITATRADCVLSSVGNGRALDAVYELVQAGAKLIVLYTENVPIHDAVKMVAYARSRQVFLMGPNSAGIISPGKANLADISDSRARAGRIGIVSKSGTLTYEVMDAIHACGFGESSVACLGGDPVVGTTYADILPLFEADADTDAVIMVGEPGGLLEYEAARYIKTMTKPVLAYIAGRHAPAQKRMGHAGAISSAGDTSASAKMQALQDVGVTIVPLVTEIGRVLAARLQP